MTLQSRKMQAKDYAHQQIGAAIKARADALTAQQAALNAAIANGQAGVIDNSMWRTGNLDQVAFDAWKAGNPIYVRKAISDY